MQESLSPEHITPLRFKSILKNYIELFKHRGFLFFSFANSFGLAGMFAYISGAPRVFISTYEVSPSAFGALFGTNALCLIISSQIGARLLRRYQPQQLFALAQKIQLAVVLIGLVATLLGYINIYGVMAILMTFMACQGFISPNAAALALSEQGHRLGTASALMGTLQMLLGALAGLAVSSWQSLSAVPLVVVLSICVALAWYSGRTALKHSPQSLP